MMSHSHQSSPERPTRLVRGRVKDPFWAAVQRRHPEIDLVLLPPDEQPPSQVDAEPR